MEPRRPPDLQVSYAIIIGIALVVAITIIFAVISTDNSLPVVDNETMENCGYCFSQFNLSFEPPGNPVEAYYWAIINIHKDPEIIIMKYEIGTACYQNCTIPDDAESDKMARRVYTGD